MKGFRFSDRRGGGNPSHPGVRVSTALLIAVVTLSLVSGCDFFINIPGTTTTTTTTTTTSTTTTSTTTTTTISMTMISVAGGTFQMGNGEEEADPIEKPVHSVTLQAFQIGRSEITQAQYAAVVGSNPSFFVDPAFPNRPVEKVSWFDAVEFCNSLSLLQGFSPVYTIANRDPSSGHPIADADVTANFSANGYRLPTEAEWEFAARGGNLSAGYLYSGSNTVGDVAWYSDNSDFTTHTVMGKAANELGIFDMAGNVGEWCNDWFGAEYYSSSTASDPTGPATSEDGGRVKRGGEWSNPSGAASCTNTVRESFAPDNTHDFLGFRVARRP